MGVKKDGGVKGRHCRLKAKDGRAAACGKLCPAPFGDRGSGSCPAFAGRGGGRKCDEKVNLGG